MTPRAKREHSTVQPVSTNHRASSKFTNINTVPAKAAGLCVCGRVKLPTQPCDAHHSGHGALRTGCTQSARGSTRGTVVPSTTAPAAPTYDADDDPTTNWIRETTTRLLRRLIRSFHRRRSRSDRAGHARHTGTSRAQYTLHSRPVHPDTLHNDSPTQRTVPGSRHSVLVSTTTPLSSATSSTCVACAEAVRLAVSLAAATRRVVARCQPTVTAQDTHSHETTQAPPGSYRQNDNWTSAWRDLDQTQPMAAHFLPRCLFVKNERSRRCGPEPRRH